MLACACKRILSRRRRGIAAVTVIVTLPVLVGFAALVVDLGRLRMARSELQTAADSAALAGASALTSDAMMKVRLDPQDSTSFTEVSTWLTDRANQFSYLNWTLGTPTLIETGDVTSGSLDVTSSTALLNTSASFDSVNAVGVLVYRSEEGNNGSIEFFFAPIFGRIAGQTSAWAVAVFDDRMAGFDITDDGAGALPFSIHEDVFNADLVGGGDDYTYDPDSDQVIEASDDIREINLYPHDVVPGNFGLLNIGTPNQGVPALRDQIENGVSPEDMEAELGTSELTFYDAEGDPTTYDITGDPGMKTALASAVENRVGQVVSFFLHDDASEQGANSVYRITQVRFGRVMDIRLTGPPTQKGMWIQPVSYSGPDVRIGANAPSSGGLAGRVVLAR